MGPLAGGQAHVCAPQTVAMAQFSADVIVSLLAKSTIDSYNKIIQEFIKWVGSLEPGLNNMPVTPLHVSMYMGVKNLHTICQGATVWDWAPYDIVLFQAMLIYPSMVSSIQGR